MNDIQICILSIFEEVAKLCIRHNIPYYAIGGTCIGAIRHKGFIPWDDDLDIAIPIEYYNDFFMYAQKQLPRHLAVLNGKVNTKYGYIWGKIIDERTTFIEDWETKEKGLYKGVFIDVMPIAGLPTDKQQREKHLKKLYRYINLNMWKRVPVHCSSSHKALLFKVLMHILLSFHDVNYYYNKAFGLLNTYPLNNSKVTGYTWHKYNGRILIFDTQWFSDTVNVPFETTMIQCPVGYHEMLCYQFNDYMKLPPVEKRISCHNPIIDLTKSYHEYENKNTKKKYQS